MRSPGARLGEHLLPGPWHLCRAALLLSVAWPLVQVLGLAEGRVVLDQLAGTGPTAVLVRRGTPQGVSLHRPRPEMLVPKTQGPHLLVRPQEAQRLPEEGSGQAAEHLAEA